MPTSEHTKLTPKNVKSLACPPGAPQWDFYDDTSTSPSSFGLRVSASGARAFFVFWRCEQTGRKGRLTLDASPNENDGLSLAREEAHEKLREIKGGLDPVEKRRREEAARESAALEATRTLTVSQLAERYTNEHDGLSDRTRREYRREFDHDLKERIGGIDARELRWSDVEPALAAIKKRAPIMANRNFAFLRAALGWAVDQGLLERNPVAGRRRPKKTEPSRERVLDDDEIAAVLRSLSSVPPLMAAAVRLLLLLGPRVGELLAMRWSDLALEGVPYPTWSVPSSARKGGTPLRLPLPRQVVEILTQLQADRRGPRVFEGLGAEPAHWFDPWRDRLLEDGKVKESFHRHDLRRTCATGCGDLGVPPHVVERILGHKGAGIVKVYQRSERLPEVATALNAWAVHVGQLESGARHQADVLPMARP